MSDRASISIFQSSDSTADRSASNRVVYGISLLTEQDIYLFREGTHSQLYKKLGSHPHGVGDQSGTLFSVWAPNATRVSVIGDFNDWNGDTHRLRPREDSSGIWEGFIPTVESGCAYKYRVEGTGGYRADKGDPYARYWQCPSQTASRVWRNDYQWNDAEWMRVRKDRNALNAPMSVYEIHLGSWRRVPDEGNRSLSYRELAAWLPEYVASVGFTHVEIMPIMEHPFYGSWGYQDVGYFAPTARYGTPEDFKALVDALHQRNIGVILDWVPSHFPGDEHGLVYFDGTPLYEHSDRREGFHPEWQSWIFNYGRHEVRGFLQSSAHSWFDEFHIDGLRVDAVASMLYRDYARPDGEWIPNVHGGRENFEAIGFLRALNESVYRDFPDVQMIAEESTAWPMVSRPTTMGGLGFGMKWNMGWMHDTLKYFKRDPVYRAHHHNEVTFSIWYAFTENFMLPLSHDEVVYGKGSLIGRLPGDNWQQFAGLRTLFGYMWAHPGKKLLFMGGEFAQRAEWNHDSSLDWHLLDQDAHRGMRDWVGDLNRALREFPALHVEDFSASGFEWINGGDTTQSVLSFVRRSGSHLESQYVIVICNFTPTPHHNYRLGVPAPGHWHEILNSDAERYGGSGQGNLGGVDSAPVAADGRFHSLSITVPPLAVVMFTLEVARDSTNKNKLIAESKTTSADTAKQSAVKNGASDDAAQRAHG